MTNGNYIKGLLAALVISFLSWNFGFMTGADTAICVYERMATVKTAKEIEACQQVNTNTPYFIIRKNMPEAWK